MVIFVLISTIITISKITSIFSSNAFNMLPYLKNGLFGRPSGKMKALSSDCNLLFNILRSLSLYILHRLLYMYIIIIHKLL